MRSDPRSERNAAPMVVEDRQFRIPHVRPQERPPLGAFVSVEFVTADVQEVKA